MREENRKREEKKLVSKKKCRKDEIRVVIENTFSGSLWQRKRGIGKNPRKRKSCGGKRF